VCVFQNIEGTRDKLSQHTSKLRHTGRETLEVLNLSPNFWVKFNSGKI